MPSASCLQEETWTRLLRLAQSGNTVLVTGSVEQDEYYLPRARMTAVDPALHVQGLRNVERTDRGEVGFYRIMGGCDAMHALDKCVKDGEESRLYTYEIGEGLLCFHPLPLELSDDKRVAAELYRDVLRRAGLGGRTFRVLDEQPNRAVLVRVLLMAWLMWCCRVVCACSASRNRSSTRWSMRARRIRSACSTSRPAGGSAARWTPGAASNSGSARTASCSTRFWAATAGSKRPRTDNSRKENRKAEK